jgi:acetylornithine/succinyldiaminopimelate/putrescine aminotransferase
MPNRVARWLSAGVPLVIGRREGYRFWDVDGHGLQDFHLNGGTFNFGHRNEELVAELVDAVQTLDVGNHHFPSEARAILAQRLAEVTPGDLHYSVFTPSGSEANDVAIKSARRATGRRKVVAFEHAYHGRSGLSGAAGENTDAEYFNSADDDFVRIPFDDADALEMALSNNDVAVFMAETLPATAGFPLPSSDFYADARRICDDHGTLFLVDEVQTGLGRSGKLWAIEHFGAEPDMLVTGKGLGGGLYPAGALVMSRDVGQWLHERGWGYVSTFGGSEIGCRVATKALEIATRPETIRQIDENAAYMRTGLDELRQRHPMFTEIRQLGAIFALRFEGDNAGITMAGLLYKAGLWAMFAAYDPAAIQFKLGLLVDRVYCDEALERLDTALSAFRHRQTPTPTDV